MTVGGAMRAVAAALASAMAVAACGSSARTTTVTHPARTATTTITTTVTPVASPAGSATTATTPGTATARTATASALAGCASGHVSISPGPSTAGLGHVGFPLLFRNSSSGPCSLTGYPGAALVAAGGRRGQLQVARTPNGYLGGLSGPATSVPIVRLAPGQTAAALLEGEDSTRGGGACPRYTALLVAPPNQTVTVRLARSMSICCPEIHPVVPGTSGRQG